MDRTIVATHAVCVTDLISQRTIKDMAKQLRMVQLNLQGLPKLEIPHGYEIRTYQQGDDVHWANIINAGFGGPRTAEHLHQDIIRRKVFDWMGLYFATHQGTPVGTACARILVPGETEMGSVHMVAVAPKHTVHKLGKRMSLCALHYFQQRDFKCVILGTNDFRLAAR